MVAGKSGNVGSGNDVSLGSTTNGIKSMINGDSGGSANGGLSGGANGGLSGGAGAGGDVIIRQSRISRMSRF